MLESEDASGDDDDESSSSLFSSSAEDADLGDDDTLPFAFGAAAVPRPRPLPPRAAPRAGRNNDDASLSEELLLSESSSEESSSLVSSSASSSPLVADLSSVDASSWTFFFDGFPAGAFLPEGFAEGFSCLKTFFGGSALLLVFLPTAAFDFEPAGVSFTAAGGGGGGSCLEAFLAGCELLLLLFFALTLGGGVAAAAAGFVAGARVAEALAALRDAGVLSTASPTSSSFSCLTE